MCVTTNGDPTLMDEFIAITLLMHKAANYCAIYALMITKELSVVQLVDNKIQ